MITAIVKAEILPEKVNQLREIANILQYNYSVNEVGCQRYESFIDGNTFITIEIWENQQVLDIHLEQEHVKTYVPQMKECIVNGIFHVTFIHSDDITQITI